jgi:hypothetical protein
MQDDQNAPERLLKYLLEEKLKQIITSKAQANSFENLSNFRFNNPSDFLFSQEQIRSSLGSNANILQNQNCLQNFGNKSNLVDLESQFSQNNQLISNLFFLNQNLNFSSNNSFLPPVNLPVNNISKENIFTNSNIIG